MSAAQWAVRAERPLAWGMWEWIIDGPLGQRRLVWGPGEKTVSVEVQSLLQPTERLLVPMRALTVSAEATAKQVRQAVSAWVERQAVDQ